MSQEPRIIDDVFHNLAFISQSGYPPEAHLSFFDNIHDHVCKEWVFKVILEIFYGVINKPTKHVIILLFNGIRGPLLLKPAKTLEVKVPAAHRASGSLGFVIPLFHTTEAERVTTHKGAVRRVAVADRALHDVFFGL